MKIEWIVSTNNDYRQGNSAMRGTLRATIRKWHETTCNADSDAFADCDMRVSEQFYQEAIDLMWEIIDNHEAINRRTMTVHRDLTTLREIADASHDVLTATKKAVEIAEKAFEQAQLAVEEGVNDEEAF